MQSATKYIEFSDIYVYSCLMAYILNIFLISVFMTAILAAILDLAKDWDHFIDGKSVYIYK